MPFFRNAAGEIVLTMSEGDFELLLMALGYATGVVSMKKEPYGWLIGLVNRINENNPNFRPYQIPEETEEETHEQSKKDS